jgi:hypothetical protein
MKHPTALHVVPEHVRRRFADALRRLAGDKRFTPAERIEFARMADAWAKTLPKFGPHWPPR